MPRAARRLESESQIGIKIAKGFVSITRRDGHWDEPTGEAVVYTDVAASKISEMLRSFGEISEVSGKSALREHLCRRFITDVFFARD
jgi:hypothetical protein